MKIPVFAGCALLALGLPLLAGCSSSPSQDQLSQLDQLQKENSSLEAKVTSLQKEKESLQASIAASDSRLTKCRADRASIDDQIKADKAKLQGKEENP